jgi:hypothetical protein
MDAMRENDVYSLYTIDDLAIRAKADGARRENGRGRERWEVDRYWRVGERRLYISFLNSVHQPRTNLQGRNPKRSEERSRDRGRQEEVRRTKGDIPTSTE